MSTKPEVGEWLAEHDVFWLSEDELVYRVSSTVIDWTAVEASDFHRAKTIAPLREYMRERAARPDPESENFLPHPVLQAFEVYAQLNPGAWAVKCNRTELTYGELDAQSDGLAVRLQQNGLGPGEFCALYMEPSLAMVRAILAVLKAGAAYLLLDPTLPDERIAAILSVSHPQTVLTQKNFLARFGATNAQIIVCDEDAADLPCSWAQEYPTRRSSPAYAISAFFDTGSLSIVVRTHMALIARLESMQEVNPINQGDSVLQNNDSALDVLDLLWPLSQGARVVIPPSRDEMDPERMRQLIAQEHITRLVPSLLRPSPLSSRRRNERRSNELRLLRASLWASEQPAVFRNNANVEVLS